jgi:hypothetical protein
VVGTIAAIIPTIPGRARLLDRARRSVHAQERPVDEIVVEWDGERTGAAATRNRALQWATSDWVAFLDDDDYWYPNHLRLCEATAERTGADLVYPWFDLPLGVPNPLATTGYRYPLGVPFDDDAREWFLTMGTWIPVTVLARRELILEAGGFVAPGTEGNPLDCCEDYALFKNLLLRGARFAHCPAVTWFCDQHGANTGGRPARRAEPVAG